MSPAAPPFDESAAQPGIRIEVLATSVGAARLALLGGADRIELCENDPMGGTTPSAGTIETVLELAEPRGVPVQPVRWRTSIVLSCGQ